MNSLKFLSAIALGCLIGHAVIDLKAEGQGQGGNIHVCADRDGTMRLAAPAAACPNGERSLFLKLAGDADMDEDNPRERREVMRRRPTRLGSSSLGAGSRSSKR